MKIWKVNKVKNSLGVHVMTQLTLVELWGWTLRIHIFYAEDTESFHSHPRGFVSLCIMGSYTEYLYACAQARSVRIGTITIRKANDIHRVVPRVFPCVTVALVTPVLRKWTRELASMRIILIGKPGTGKGTQGTILAERYAIPHISIGDVCRQIASDSGHELHQALQQHFTSGDRWSPLPDELAVQIVQSAIAGLHDGWILDGFPRNMVQASLLTLEPTHVLYLDLSDEQCIQRVLSRGRQDDGLDKVQERLRVEAGRLPGVLAYFESKKCLHTIDASQEPSQVFADIIQVCEPE
jgi:adenylate kinase